MRRRLLVWLVGSALLATVVFLVGCAVSTSVAPVLPAKHISYPAGTACDAVGCHTQYKHQEPYLGPCDTCHNLTDWKQVTYKHKDPTFDNGMHSLVGCSTCHTEGNRCIPRNRRGRWYCPDGILDVLVNIPIGGCGALASEDS